MSIGIRRAREEDLEPLVSLFDAYRQFYGQPTDLRLARSFLEERFQRQESLVLVSERSGSLLGFVQLFPSFSSVSARRSFILNDLFVVPEARRLGVARALLHEAAQLGRSLGAVRLSLSTAKTNHAAQALYASLGWTRDEVFLHYTLSL